MERPPRPNRWQSIKKLAGLLFTPATNVAHQIDRIRFIERNVGLLVKVAGLGIIGYFIYFSNWFDGLNSIGQVALEPVRTFFLAYVIINLGVAAVLLSMHRLPLSLVRWVVGTNNFIDGLFTAAVVIVTGGMESPVYWVFLGLIVRNAVSIPVAIPQVVLNVLATASYLLAGLLYQSIIALEPLVPSPPAAHIRTVTGTNTDNATTPSAAEEKHPDTFQPKHPGEDLSNPLLAETSRTASGVWLRSQGTELFLVRIALLLLMTACGCGVQILLDYQQTAEEEARAFAMRQEQLRATSRLAAEIAHQLKNPLAIINNTVFTLQRSLKNAPPGVMEKLEMVREEVARSDQILTELMGYAQLGDYRVDKLKIADELEAAVGQVFPAGAGFEVGIKRDFAPNLPCLLMQRGHLKEIFVNLLQNARDAMEGNGTVEISARPGTGAAFFISIQDNGPGIEPRLQERIFEAYFSTKSRGTGLGLAIVKQNMELYGGSVRVESELGKGACFILQFPPKAIMNGTT